ncbi:MAG TPA: SRPBCC family protein [Dehalococcoidia bacterium]|nr:SRPBCC family protein [Dehalococcoidia bacterium]
MADYRFVTIWQLRAPIQDVWQAIHESEKWPSWWKGVLSVSEVPGKDENVKRYVWKSILPYKLAFDMEVTRVEAPRHLEGKASGELEGTGVWELSENAGITTVKYTWAVKTTRLWMNLLAPLARPAFAWNHDYVMKHGAEGLAKLLKADLLSK